MEDKKNNVEMNITSRAIDFAMAMPVIGIGIMILALCGSVSYVIIRAIAL